MSSNQIIFSIIFVGIGVTFTIFNKNISIYMTGQWLKGSEWLIPSEVRERPVYDTYKKIVYVTYRIIFYGGAVLCLGAIALLLGAAVVTNVH
jgi:hypothetical protein